MLTAELVFPIHRTADLGDVSQAVNILLLLYRANGQVLNDEWSIAATKQAIRVYLSVPERAAFERPASRWIRAARRRLRSVGLNPPRLRIIGPAPESAEVCQCRKSSSYLLYTDAYSMESPLRCGECFGVVPLYRVPPTDEECYDSVLWWQRNFQSFDGQWFRLQGREEKAAYRQLADVNSVVARQGRAVCSMIEKHTHRATYYYLYRYYGRSSKRELASRCPSCNGAWRLDERWHKRFDFRCDKCRLISQVAVDVASLP